MTQPIKNDIHALVIRYWRTDMHLHFSRKHCQWALFLDRKRVILFKKDNTYDLHQASILWLQRYLWSALIVGRRFLKMAVYWAFDWILQAFHRRSITIHVNFPRVKVGDWYWLTHIFLMKTNIFHMCSLGNCMRRVNVYLLQKYKT